MLTRSRKMFIASAVFFLSTVACQAASVSLAWDYPADVQVNGFTINRRINTPGSIEAQLTSFPGGEIRTYTDTTVSSGVAYCYRVQAFSDYPFPNGTESEFSNEACTGIIGVLAVPVDLRITGTT